MRGSVGSCPHHGSFLPDVYGLFDPSGKTLWLSVDHCRLIPVDDMVLLGCVVGESGFVMFCHQLVSSDGDRQRTRAFYQMDQRGHTHPEGTTTDHEP